MQSSRLSLHTYINVGAKLTLSYAQLLKFTCLKASHHVENNMRYCHVNINWQLYFPFRKRIKLKVCRLLSETEHFRHKVVVIIFSDKHTL